MSECFEPQVIIHSAMQRFSLSPERKPIFLSADRKQLLTMNTTPRSTEQLHAILDDALAISEGKQGIVTPAKICDGSSRSQAGNVEEWSSVSTYGDTSPVLPDQLHDIELGPSSTVTADGYGPLAEEAGSVVSPPMNIKTHQYEYISEEDDICSDGEDNPDKAKNRFRPGDQATSVSTQATTTSYGGTPETLKIDLATLNTSAVQSNTTPDAPLQMMNSNQTSFRCVGELVDEGLEERNQYRRNNRSSTVSIDPRTMKEYAHLGMSSSNVGSFRVNTELYPDWRQCSQLSVDSELVNSDYLESSSDTLTSKNKGYESTSLRNNMWSISEKERHMVNNPKTDRFGTPLGLVVKSSNHISMEPRERSGNFDKPKCVESFREASMALEDSLSQLYINKNKEYESDSLRNNKWNISEEEHHMVYNPNTGRFGTPLGLDIKGSNHEVTERSGRSGNSWFAENQMSEQRGHQARFDKPKHVESSQEASITFEDSFSQLCMERFQDSQIHEQIKSPTPPVRAPASTTTLDDSSSQLCMERFQDPDIFDQIKSPRPPVRASSFKEGTSSSCQVVEERPYSRIQSLPTPTLHLPDYTFNDQSHQSHPNIPFPTRNPDQSRGSTHSNQVDSRRQSMDLPPHHAPQRSSDSNSYMLKGEESTSHMHVRDSNRMQSPPADRMESLHGEPTVHTTNQAALEKEETTTPPPARPCCIACEIRESQRNLMDEHRRSPPSMPPYMDPRASFDPRAYWEMNQSESFYQRQMQIDPRMAGFYQDPRTYMDPSAMKGTDGSGVQSEIHNERSHADPRATFAMAAREGMSHPREPIVDPISPAVDPRMMDPRLMDPGPPIDPRMVDPWFMGYPGFPSPPIGWGYPQFGNEKLHTDRRAAMAARKGMSLSEPIINSSSPAVDPRMMDPRLMNPIPPIDPRMMDPRLMRHPSFPPPPMMNWGYRSFGSVSSYSQDDSNQFVIPELSEQSHMRTPDPLPTRMPLIPPPYPYMHSPYPYPSYDPYAYMAYMSSYPPPSMILHHSGTSTSSSSMAPSMPPAPLAYTAPSMNPVLPKPTLVFSPNKTPDVQKTKRTQWKFLGFLKKSSSVNINNKPSSVVEDRAKPPTAVPARRKKFFGRK
jgi:hypothetical protein